MRKRGRRGGEKRKGIVIGGMVLSLLMGCNNGGEERLAAQKRLSEIGRSAENVFYSFMDLIADSLGFTVKADTKKSEVGEHFNKLGVKIGEASDKLEEVAKKAETGDDKSDSSKDLIREAVDAAKTTLSALKGHLESLKDIGDSSQNVGWAASNANGEAASTDKLKATFKALKGIVDTAEKEGVAKPKVGTTAVKVGSADNANGAKILAAGGTAGGSAVGEKAAAIVSLVSGEEILASIVKSQEGDATSSNLGGTANATTSALKFARGDSTPSNKKFNISSYCKMISFSLYL